MAEPFTLEQLKSHPIMGTWSIEGKVEEFPGFLFLEGENLNLTLYLTFTGGTPSNFLVRTDPRLSLFAPPSQPTLHGETKTAGRVTLFNCAQVGHQASNRSNPPETRTELILRPSEAWFGNDFVSTKWSYQELNFSAPGLHNILSTLHIEHQFLTESKSKRKSPAHKLKKLTGANQAFLVYHHEQPNADITRGGKAYRVEFATSVSESGSSTEGVSITTSDSVSIRSERASLTELMNLESEIEQFLSLLCVGPVRAERISVQLDKHARAQLLWRLGRPVTRTEFTLMPHQMLVPLGRHPDLAKKALEKWFKANEAMRLARWLIFDALFTEESSAAKFLSVAQAWEIAGREESKAAPYDKRKFKNACKEIDKILKSELGNDAAKRLLELLTSSNRESFGNFVQNMTTKLPELSLQSICRDIPTFVSTVVMVRNILTHMQSTKKMSIIDASHLSFFLTFKLVVLFCIHACKDIGLPLAGC